MQMVARPQTDLYTPTQALKEVGINIPLNNYVHVYCLSRLITATATQLAITRCSNGEKLFDETLFKAAMPDGITCIGSAQLSEYRRFLLLITVYRSVVILAKMP